MTAPHPISGPVHLFTTQIMLVMTVVCAGFSLPTGPARASAAEPPPPNPKGPVNYAAWINAEYQKDLRDNAAELYQQAIAAKTDDQELADLAGMPVSEWSAPQREKAKAWLERNKAAFEKLTAAAAKKQCFFVLKTPDGSMVNVALPEVRDLRTLAKMLTVRARLRLAGGDTDGALQDAVTLFGLATHLEAQPNLLSYLVAAATRSSANAVFYELPAQSPDQTDFAAILQRLSPADADPPSPQRQFAMEKLLTLDLAQAFLKDQNGDGRFESFDAPGAASRKFDPPATLDEICRDVNQYYADLDKAVSLDYSQARTALADFNKRRSASADPLVRDVAPDFSRVMTIYAETAAFRRGTLLVLHLHAYRAKNGRWPADVRTALPPDQQSLATDPLSGQLFVYRLEKNEPRLYSVSENGQDDGGEVFKKNGKPAWGETGDYVFWPPPAK